MSPAVVFIVFGLVAVAELPDKTMIATVVMGSRNRPRLVWAGAAAAFLVHVCIAVAAGRLIDLLPHETVQIVVTALFAAGAVVLLALPEKSELRRGQRAAESRPVPTRAMKVVAGAFVVILLGEWGDLTQVLTVTLVARYHQPWAVGIGAYAALLAVSALASFGGQALARRVPLEWVRRAGGVVLLAFTAYGIYSLAA